MLPVTESGTLPACSCLILGVQSSYACLSTVFHRRPLAGFPGPPGQVRFILSGHSSLVRAQAVWAPAARAATTHSCSLLGICSQKQPGTSCLCGF